MAPVVHFLAGVNEARVVAMTYDPVAIDTVKKVVTDDVSNRADAVRAWFTHQQGYC